MTEEIALREPREGTKVSLWRHRNFLLLWSGQTVSELGTRISAIAVPLFAVTSLGATTFQASLLTFLTWLPYLLISLPAGVVADRLNKRKLMIWCDIARTGLIAALPVIDVFSELTFWHLYVVVAAVGVLTVLFNVAYKSQLPELVNPGQLVEGNGKLGVSQSLAELTGPALAGVLVGLIGALRTLVLDAVSFLVSAVTLALIRPEKPPAESTPKRDEIPFREAIAQGLSFVRHHAELRAVLACTSTSNLFVMAMTSIEIVFLVNDLHASPVVIGLVFTVGTVGGLVTGLLAPHLSSLIGSARIIWVSMVTPGPLYLLIPLSSPGWGILYYAIGLTAFSANAVLFNATSGSYRQRACPPELLGRVSASFLWAAYGVIPVGALVGGALASWIGMRPTLWVCVLGMWSASLFVVFSPLRKLRDVLDDAPRARG